MEQKGHWGLWKGTVCHPGGAQQSWGPSQVRRHRSIHEVDISDLEAALRSDDPGKVYETPQEEIARLRKMELEPQHYDVDINKEVRTGCPGGAGSLGMGHPYLRTLHRGGGGQSILPHQSGSWRHWLCPVRGCPCPGGCWELGASGAGGCWMGPRR